MKLLTSRSKLVGGTGPTVSPAQRLKQSTRGSSQRFLPRPQRITCFFLSQGRVLGFIATEWPANPRANGVYDADRQGQTEVPSRLRAGVGHSIDAASVILHTRDHPGCESAALGAAASVVRSSRSTNFATWQVTTPGSIWRRVTGEHCAILSTVRTDANNHCAQACGSSRHNFSAGITQEITCFCWRGVALSMLPVLSTTGLAAH